MCRNGRGRNGLTLVELLAVIMIMALIAALLLPAIQATRESARHASCCNNLRQIGVALQRYESTHRTFPSGYLSRYSAADEDLGPGWGWAAVSLHYLEENSIGELLRLDRSIEDATNADERTRPIRVYTCPSDPSEPTWTTFTAFGDFGPAPASKICEVASSNYVGMSGSTSLGIAGNGVFFRNSRVDSRDITDGTSRTIAVGERSQRFGQATWVGSVAGALLGPLPGADDSAKDHLVVHGSGMVLGRAGGGKRPGDPTGDRDMFFSQHPGGVNFAFADGHVECLSEETDDKVFASLSTRAGNEIVPGDYAAN